MSKQKKQELVRESAEGASMEPEIVVEVPREQVAVAVRPLSEVEGAVSVMPPASIPSVEVKVARPFYEGLEGVITDVNIQYYANITSIGIVTEITRDDGERIHYMELKVPILLRVCGCS